jgi:hemerythrin superfamily protein
MATPDTVQDASRDAAITMADGFTTINAIELLEADHRQVEEWFQQFDATDDASRKETLAADICKALEVHARLEEEIFYPAFLEATGSEAIHHEAVVEHEGAKELIAKIRLSPGVDADDYFDARVKVLGEMIQHHVTEEERPGGMFALAAISGMDLEGLGARIEQRKLQLMADADTDAGYDEAVDRAEGQ